VAESSGTQRGPFFTFDGDGAGSDEAMLFTNNEAERNLKRVKGNDGVEVVEPGPIRRIMTAQFGTINAKLDKALQKVATQEGEIGQLKKKLDEANEHNREQWRQFVAKWATMETLIGSLSNKLDQHPRTQDRQSEQEAQRGEGSQRNQTQTQPVTPRPKEPASKELNLNTQKRAPPQQQQILK
jgi:hypothetical protein